METQVGRIREGIIHSNLGGTNRSSADQIQFTKGRVQNIGYKIGHYLQTPPLFFTRDGHTVPLIDKYRGYPAFLIGGGPSFKELNKTLLDQPGIITMGVNNSPKTYRPKLWTAVDPPTQFLTSIWRDPCIEKFYPYDFSETNILDSFTREKLPIKVGDCPNVWFFRRNEYFVPERFLFEDTINWGNHTELGGSRSCMLPAVRILFLLGFRTIFLIGVDFQMTEDKKYHFEQERTDSSIRSNNETYKTLNRRFGELRPIFELHDLHIFNCNPQSGLTAFDHIPYEEAIKMCTNILPDLANEPTAGMYDKLEPKITIQEKKKQADIDHDHLVIGPGITFKSVNKTITRLDEKLNKLKLETEVLEFQASTNDYHSKQKIQSNLASIASIRRQIKNLQMLKMNVLKEDENRERITSLVKFENNMAAGITGNGITWDSPEPGWSTVHYPTGGCEWFDENGVKRGESDMIRQRSLLDKKNMEVLRNEARKRPKPTQQIIPDGQASSQRPPTTQSPMRPENRRTGDQNIKS